MNNVEVWLWLLLVMLPHNSRTHELLKHYGSVLSAARAMRDGQCTMLTEQERRRVKTVHTKEVRQVIEDCRSKDIQILTMDDIDYPQGLRSIPNAPVVLFLKGNSAAMSHDKSLAVVGARKISDYSRRCAEYICLGAAENGIALISGLAVGADTTAHRAALDKGAVTVGVMACGLNVGYPPENAGLKEEIISNGGAIISELLPNAEVDRHYFQLRNRIIAGLGSGTLIIQASEKSGTMLTAKHTIQQRKPVFVIPPHDIFDESYGGQIALIRKSATVVSSAEDICKRFGVGFSVSKEPLHRQSDTYNVKSSTPVKERSATMPDITGLPQESGRIVQTLMERSLSIDEIIAATGLSHSVVCSSLLDLEMDDYVIRRQDGNYSLS